MPLTKFITCTQLKTSLSLRSLPPTHWITCHAMFTFKYYWRYNRKFHWHTLKIANNVKLLNSETNSQIDYYIIFRWNYLDFFSRFLFIGKEITIAAVTKGHTHTQLCYSNIYLGRSLGVRCQVAAHTYLATVLTKICSLLLIMLAHVLARDHILQLRQTSCGCMGGFKGMLWCLLTYVLVICG